MHGTPDFLTSVLAGLEIKPIKPTATARTSTRASAVTAGVGEGLENIIDARPVIAPLAAAARRQTGAAALLNNGVTACLQRRTEVGTEEPTAVHLIRLAVNIHHTGAETGPNPHALTPQQSHTHLQ